MTINWLIFEGDLSRIISICWNSQNIYFCHRKPTNKGLFLLAIAVLVCWNCKQVSLAADAQDGNALQLENLRLNFSSCFQAFSKNRY